MAKVIEFRQNEKSDDQNNCEGKYYHNAKKLLKIYASVMWQLENSLNEMDLSCADFGYESIHDALDFLATGLDDELEGLKLNDNVKSMLFSRSLIQIIDRALLALRNYPKNGERYFDIINKMYILHYKYSEDEILDALNISRRTLYREKKKAVSMLGTILWGFMLPEVLKMPDVKMALKWH